MKKAKFEDGVDYICLFVFVVCCLFWQQILRWIAEFCIWGHKFFAPM